MPKPCSLCVHPRKKEIDKDVLKGLTMRAIAGSYGTTPSTVQRHTRHIHESVKLAIAERQEAGEKNYRQSLLEQVNEAKRIAKSLIGAAHTRGSLAAAATALGKLLDAIELDARLSGELAGSGMTVNINNGMTTEEALQFARELLELHGMRVIEAQAVSLTALQP